jgi:selenophosphate synthase
VARRATGRVCKPDRSHDIWRVEQAILTDPQTSGGLLVACAPESVNDVLNASARGLSARRRYR